MKSNRAKIDPMEGGLMFTSLFRLRTVWLKGGAL